MWGKVSARTLHEAGRATGHVDLEIHRLMPALVCHQRAAWGWGCPGAPRYLAPGMRMGWGGMGPGCQASPDRPPRGAPATPGTPHCEEPLAPGHLALLCVGGRADGKTYPKWNLETGIKFVFTLTLGKILPGSNREKKIKK